MANRPAGPYIFEIPYVADGMTHPLTINCDTIGNPATGTNPSFVTLRSKDGTGVILSGAADAFWAVARAFFVGAVLASSYTLWKTNVLNSEREFVSAGTLTVPNGLTGATYLSQQMTLTWRSGGGNIAKLVLLDVNQPGNARVPTVSSGIAAVTALNSWVLSGSSFLMARDRSFPVAPMNYSLGQNEVLFNKRFRQ